jgi:hypothetical protein
MADSVGLTDSVVRSLVKGLGLGVRRLAGIVGLNVGVERLRALPNMSFAADATIQLPPPPPLPLLVNTTPSIPPVRPELDITPGPPIPAAAPVRLDTSDEILAGPQLGIPNCRKGFKASQSLKPLLLEEVGVTLERCIRSNDWTEIVCLGVLGDIDR